MLIAGARGSPASNTPQASLAATLQVFVTFADTDFVTSVSRQAGSLFLNWSLFRFSYGGQVLQGSWTRFGTCRRCSTRFGTCSRCSTRSRTWRGCWTRTDHPTLFPTCSRDTSTSVRTRLGMQLNIPEEEPSKQHLFSTRV